MNNFFSILVLFCFPTHYVRVSGDDACWTVMRKLVGGGEVENRNVDLTPIKHCQNCQGRPGKMGPEGPPGPRGDRGFKGYPGSCKCDLSEIHHLKKRLEHLEKIIERIPEACYIGIANGHIPMSRITSSSRHHTCPMENIRLNSVGGWCAASNQVGTDWIQVDLASVIPVTAIFTQGRKNSAQWVRSYTVAYGNSTSSMLGYKENGVVKVFTANWDRDTIVTNRFSTPLQARYIRIYPALYSGHMSMRFELSDC